MKKEEIRLAVIAGRQEVIQLQSYQLQHQSHKNFEKTDLQNYPSPPSTSSKSCPPPYHSLRTDLHILLGPSGSKLIQTVWSKHHLSPSERDSRKLRPALIKLFSVTARIASTRGLGNAVKRLLSEFEQNYFRVVSAETELETNVKEKRRFALLSALQKGQGSHLLHTVLGDDRHSEASPTLPSKHLPSLGDLTRRYFLFESARRSKSWTTAYRQARVLLSTDQRLPKSNLRAGLSEISRHIGSKETHPDKKKRLLSLLAKTCEQESQAALQAISYPNLECCPGFLETEVCRLLSPEDPRWRVSLDRLYRHRDSSHRWEQDLRSLCQSSPRLRNFCRVLFSLLRYSRKRARAMAKKQGLARLCQPLDSKRVRKRLRHIKAEVKRNLELFPRVDSEADLRKAKPYELNSELWSHLGHVCSLLQTEFPYGCYRKTQDRVVRVQGFRGRKFITVSSEFLSLPRVAKHVLLARAVYREAAGLDLLQDSIDSWIQPTAISQRARDYAEWQSHDYAPLDQLGDSAGYYPTVLAALEEMYWATNDKTYRELARVCHYASWCPLFDREADLFSSCFGDLISVSHALVADLLTDERVKHQCTKHGLSSLVDAPIRHPSVCLRLQTVWINTAQKWQIKI